MDKKEYRIPLFCIVTALFWFSLYSYVPVFSTYIESLGASYSMIGLIVGSYGFTQMLLRIPLGIVSDRLNKRKIFVVAGIASSLVSALGLLGFTNVGVILLSRSMAGVAAASWVAFTVMFSSYFKKDQATQAMGFLSSLNSAGQMTAMFLGGIVAQYFSPRATFALGAVAAFICLLMSFGIVEKEAENPKRMELSRLISVARNRNFILVCFLAILSQFITFATVYGFTPVAAEAIGANSFQLGLLTSLSTLPGIFAAAMSGSVFAKRLGEVKTVVTGFVICTLSTVVIPYLGSVWVLCVAQVIGGFGRGMILPLLMGLSIKNVEEAKRATAMGFFQAIYGIGMFLGPFAVGIISDTAGLEWGFWITGIVGLAGAAMMRLYNSDKAAANDNAAGQQ